MLNRIVAEDTAASSTKARKEKVPFSIDFSLPPTLTQKELFAPGGAATSLPRKSVSTSSSRRSSRPAVKEENWTLPADYQFNSASLLRLFLKPKTAVGIFLALSRTSSRGGTD